MLAFRQASPHHLRTWQSESCPTSHLHAGQAVVPCLFKRWNCAYFSLFYFPLNFLHFSVFISPSLSFSFSLSFAHSLYLKTPHLKSVCMPYICLSPVVGSHLTWFRFTHSQGPSRGELWYWFWDTHQDLLAIPPACRWFEDHQNPVTLNIVTLPTKGSPEPFTQHCQNWH